MTRLHFTIFFIISAIATFAILMGIPQQFIRFKDIDSEIFCFCIGVATTILLGIAAITAPKGKV